MSEGRKVLTVIVRIFPANSSLKMQSVQVSEKKKRAFSEERRMNI